MAVKKLTPEEIRLHKGISFPGVSTAFICHDGRGHIFLAQRSKNTRDEHDHWDCGAGGLKHGQGVLDNLKRELLEEYGVKPKQIDFLGYLDAFRKTHDGQPTHWLAMYFAVLVDPKKIKIREPDMVDSFGWFSLDDLPSPMHSMFGKFNDAYGAKLRLIMGEPKGAKS